MASTLELASGLKKSSWVFHSICVLLFILWCIFQSIGIAVTFYFFFAVGLALLIADGARSKAQPPARPVGKIEVQAETQPIAIQALEPTRILHDRYEIVKQLKVGGMAVISLVTDRTTGLPCIIKRPRLDTPYDIKINVEKLEIEAKNLRQFNHPNIVRYIDSFVEDNIPNLIVDFIDGEDMLSAFSEKQADEAHMLKWADQILGALTYIHEHRAVHRDLNPNNIMLRNDGDIVIIDFGTIKPPAVSGGTEVRKAGFEVPEQVLGYSDERSDIYSVGGTLFYLLTSRKPGDIGTYISRVDGMLTKEYGVSERTAKCIAQALKMDADSRFQSAVVMRNALCG